MRNGQIEQLGTPEEIYNRPATLYVATFVGAPPMNLLDVVVTANGLLVAGSDAVIPLPPDMLAGLPRDRDVKLGIRPECFRTEPGPLHLTLRCEVTELTGPELLLSGNIGGQRLVAALPPRTGAAAGADVTLAFDVEMLHLFDAENGLRIETA
jgi:multiple sugar transport system ATP-binding protein